MTNRVGSNWLKELAQLEKSAKDYYEASKKLTRIYKKKNKKQALEQMLTPKSVEGENEDGI
jgi:hypothetical protein